MKNSFTIGEEMGWRDRRDLAVFSAFCREKNVFGEEDQGAA